MFVRIGSLVVEIIEKIVSANCINFSKIGYLKNITYFRYFQGPLKAVQPAIMLVEVYWLIRIINMLNKKQPAFIKNRI